MRASPPVFVVMGAIALVPSSCGDSGSTTTGSSTGPGGIDASTSTATSGATETTAGTTPTTTGVTEGSSAGSSSGGVVEPSCGDDPALTANEKTLIEMPADTWIEAPNTRFNDFCEDHEPAGAHTVSGCPAIINAWGGGAWDPVHRQMILWGGGHNDYWGNEVYGFSTRTFAWELLVPGTEVPTIDDLSEPMSDGAPVSRHTYDGLAYLTAEDRFFAFGGATAPSGSTSVLTWSLDLEAKAWTRLDQGMTLPVNPDGHYYMATAYDEIGRRVWMRNEDGVYVFDLVADTWTRLLDAGYPPYYPNWSTSRYRRGIFDPTRSVFFSIGGKTGDGALDLFAFDTLTSKDLLAEWQTIGAEEVAEIAGPGADLDPVADAIVAWGGGPARVLDLKTKTWTAKSGVGAPETPIQAGTYGRFRYIAQYNVFILVNEGGQNVYFYKHTPGCAP